MGPDNVYAEVLKFWKLTSCIDIKLSAFIKRSKSKMY